MVGVVDAVGMVGVVGVAGAVNAALHVSELCEINFFYLPGSNSSPRPQHLCDRFLGSPPVQLGNRYLPWTHDLSSSEDRIQLFG